MIYRYTIYLPIISPYIYHKPELTSLPPRCITFYLSRWFVAPQLVLSATCRKP